jgi:hypothetical protein
MIEGTPAITMTLPIQNPGAPDTLLRMRSQSRKHPGGMVKKRKVPLAGARRRRRVATYSFFYNGCVQKCHISNTSKSKRNWVCFGLFFLGLAQGMLFRPGSLPFSFLQPAGC